MARLGQLYLNEGRWAGQQLIDARYIRDAITPTRLNGAYGYLWWLNATGRVTGAPRSMYYAAGARGQFCFTLPEQEMVIATMGFGEKQLSAEDASSALDPFFPWLRNANCRYAADNLSEAMHALICSLHQRCRLNGNRWLQNFLEPIANARLELRCC